MVGHGDHDAGRPLQAGCGRPAAVKAGLQAACKRACNNAGVEGLEIRVLGGIALARDGERLPIGGPKPRRLLGLLVAGRGDVVSADRLCEELWGEEQPADPGAVLQSNISRLRKLLRPEATIVGRPPGYVLEIDERAVDARRFEALCDLGRRAPTPAVAAERLREALACWRGGAFEEFAELDWARIEAVRLEELRANAREDLVEARLSLGEHAALVGELDALAAEQPLRERLHHQLVIALYRSGRTAEALRHADDHRRHLREELGLEPSPAFRDLEARLLNEDPSLLASAGARRRSRPRPLPAETTELLGRDEELADLADRLREERLVTLTGPGGVGKTRLAERLAHDLWDDFDGEVFVAELAPVRDPGSTVAAIATAADVQQRQHLSVEETLTEYLRSRRALLVLDNCEHLVASVAPLVERILELCPDVTVLATSRAVLGLPSEQVARVGPLDVVAEDDGADAPAVQLFVTRARAARHGFDPDADDLGAVEEIVRRLDGLPLAIELAAARLRAMSPRQLADRLDGRFEILAGSQSARVERHRTVADLVAWSYDLLEPDERRLFGRVGVFAGSFGLDAAEGVCGDDGLGPTQVSVLLANLVDKSMVQLLEGPEPRYRLLETLREFTREQVGDAEHAAVRRRHARWYLDLAERCARTLTGPDERAAVATLDVELDNLRAAHGFAIERGDVDLGLRLVAALREYGFRCMHAEVTTWAAAVTALAGAESHDRFPVVLAADAYGRFVRGDLERATELAERAWAASEQLGVDESGLAARTLGNVWFYRGEPERGVEWMERMVESARREGSPARLAHALYMRSVAHTSLGEYVKGAQLAGEAAAAARASGSPTARAQAEYALGLALESANPEEASEHLRESVELARAAGNRWIEAFALTEVLWLQARQGEPRAALAGYADVVELWYRGGDWANQWLSLRHVFGILVQLRAHLGAATLHGGLSAAGAAYALPLEAADREHLTALVEELRTRLGASAFATAVRHGASLRDGELVDFARQQIHALSGRVTDPVES